MEKSTPSSYCKKTRIKIDTLSNHVDVYFSDNIYSVVKKLIPGELTEVEAGSYAAGFFTRPRPKKPNITDFFIVFNAYDLSANTIAHESMHFVTELMFYHGITLDPHNSEPYCYTLGYVVGKIHEKASKLGLLIKDK